MISKDTLVRLEFDKLLHEIAAGGHSDVTRKRLLATEPLGGMEEIRTSLACVEEIRSLDRLGISLALNFFEDIHPFLEQVKPAGAFLGPSELLIFGPVLTAFSNIARQFVPRMDIPHLKAIDPALKGFPDILEPLEASIDQDGAILDGASPLLRETRKAKRSLAARIRKKIEEIVRASGIEIFLQDDFITQRSGRWVIPVRMDSKGMVRGVVHDVSASGETAFMEPLEIIPFVNELENLTADEKAEEIRILRQLSECIREDAAEIASCFDTLIYLDSLNAIARFAADYMLESPVINQTGQLRLVEARHPLLLMLQRRGVISRVEPLNLVMDAAPADDATNERDTCASVMVITGPNAGGKTIALKTAGILSLMALCGLPVPAGPRSSFPLFDTLLVDIGDEQSIEQSHSTFSAHAARIAAILAQAGPRTLVLLDELGAGTEPLQGAAIACGVLRELQEKCATVIATTHLTEIIGFVHRSPGMMNAGMEFDDRSFTPLYRLIVGEPGQSHAVEIARRFGMPERVIDFARQMLGTAGSEFSLLLAELRQKRVELENSRRSLENRERRLDTRSSELDARAAEMRTMVSEAVEKARSDAAELISSTRRKMNDLLEELKREKRTETIEKLRRAEVELADRLQSMAAPDAAHVPLNEVKPGDQVRICSLGCDGVVIQLDGRQVKARVRVGRMELDVPVEDLAAPQKKGGKETRPSVTASWKSDVAESDERELKLIGLRVDEALSVLETYLNHVSAAGLREVRIIHGVGTGKLREAVREHLERHPLVEEQRPGGPHEGRDGATVVKLRQ